MISITKASVDDCATIAGIGKISVKEAHQDSCSARDLNEFIAGAYNDNSIKKELSDAANIYHLIRVNGSPAGFSKIVLNASHPNIFKKNTTKLDRIYLLKEFFGLKLGYELMTFNIELARNGGQSGMWLFTWVGNTQAVNFYLKTGFEIVGSHNFKVSETHYNPNHQMFLDFEKYNRVL
jgi:ribosomal protein S18 acetylase RimI-like enzyme